MLRGLIPTQGSMHVRLRKSRIQYYTDHLPPLSLLPTLTTAAPSPVHTGSAANSNLVPKKLFVPKPSVKHHYSRLFLVLPRFHLARIERGWLGSPKPEISSLLTYTIPHGSQGGSISDQKVRGMR